MVDGTGRTLIIAGVTTNKKAPSLRELFYLLVSLFVADNVLCQ